MRREMFGEHLAGERDRPDEARAGRAGLDAVGEGGDGRRPMVGRNSREDRGVGDDLGDAVGQRDVDQDAGMGARRADAAGLELGDRGGVDVFALDAARGQRRAEPGADEQRGDRTKTTIWTAA